MLSKYLIATQCAFVGLSLALPTDPPQNSSSGGGVYSLRTYIPKWRKDDQFYNVDVNFGGQDLPVFVDTGSGDLFVASDQCNVVNVESGCYLSKTYSVNSNTKFVNEEFGTVVGVGTVYGNQTLMTVTLGGKVLKNYTVPLIYAADSGEFQQGSFSGIFGLSPRNVSRNLFFNNRQPIIDTLITTGALKEPKFSLSFPRLGDPKSSDSGTLTLGGIERLPAGVNVTYNEIINSPNYNYDNDPLSPQSWTAELQAIRINNVAVNISRGVINPSGQYMSLMDSGSQQILLRRDEFDAVAKGFKGKTIYHEDSSIYFDCSVPQLLELKYHDKWFAVDPLDLIIPSDHGVVDGVEMCHAALGTWDRSFADSILGVPFLRNVVSVYDYVTADLYSVQPRFGLAGLTNGQKAVERYASVYKNRLS